MATQTATLLTAKEFEALGDIGSAELLCGKVVYLTRPTPRHGRIATRLAMALVAFVEPRKLGEVYASKIGYVVEHNPDTVRSPDVSFVRAEIALGHDEDEWYPHSPDLAVEVLSPSDRPGNTAEKIQMWLDTGGRSAWVVEPVSRTAVIHRVDGSVELVPADGVLRDDSVLPGFAMLLRDVFAR